MFRTGFLTNNEESITVYTAIGICHTGYVGYLLAGSGCNAVPSCSRCPKHVAFYSKNKFEKLVNLAGFIIRKYHNPRSSECQNVGWSMEGIDLAHDKGRWQAFCECGKEHRLSTKC